MMRGPTYDDSYITRKMASMQSNQSFLPPMGIYARAPVSYLPQYLQLPTYDVTWTPSGSVQERWYLPTPSSRLAFLQDRDASNPHKPFPRRYWPQEAAETARARSPSPSPRPPGSKTGYIPSARTQLILNRLALSPPPPPTRPYVPVGPPRMVPRTATYYDYDYGYGGGYGGYGAPPPYMGSYGGGYAPPSPAPRLSRYDHYLDDDVDMPYTPRYRHRPVTTDLDDTDAAMKAITSSAEDDDALLSHRSKTRFGSQERQVSSSLETEGDRHLARLQHRYPGLSEPQALQDHVDKMRIRLKSLAFSLDPSGPVPEIVIPERSRKTEVDTTRKYGSGAAMIEYTDLPRLSSRRTYYYPEDEHMKDNLRIKCLSHYKTTRTAADYWKPKNYNMDDAPKRMFLSSQSVMPDAYSSKYPTKISGAKWEEPDTVFGPLSDRKPFSKTEGEAVNAVDAMTEERKERKKKTPERVPEIPAETKPAEVAVPAATPAAEATAAAAPAAPAEAPAAAPAAAAAATEASAEEVLDEKERKRLEKKKRKAEREAAAKAAMEAELEALAKAELELAKLDQQAASSAASEASTKPETTTTTTTSESAPAKCESTIQFESEECLPPAPQPKVPSPPPQVPEDEQRLPQAPAYVSEFVLGQDEEEQTKPAAEPIPEPTKPEPQSPASKLPPSEVTPKSPPLEAVPPQSPAVPEVQAEPAAASTDVPAEGTIPTPGTYLTEVMSSEECIQNTEVEQAKSVPEQSVPAKEPEIEEASPSAEPLPHSTEPTETKEPEPAVTEENPEPSAPEEPEEPVPEEVVPIEDAPFWTEDNQD